MLIKTAIIKKIKSKLSDIAKYLEEAGMCGAKELRKAMDAIDGSFVDDEDYLMDSIVSSTPDIQNALPGSMPTALHGGFGGRPSLFPGESVLVELASGLIDVANTLDKTGHYEEASEIDELLEELLSDEEFEIIEDLEEKEDDKKKKKVKPDEEDKVGAGAMVDSNGRVGTGVTDNQSAGMFQGFSDAYFYSGYGNLEGAYGPTDR